jgi:integrase
LVYIPSVGKQTRPSRRTKGTGSIQQRGPRTWRLRVFVGTDPVTGHPKQRTKTIEAKNQTEARAALRGWQRELDDNRSATDSTASVRSLVEEWLRHSEARGRAPSTLHDARRSAETVIFPEFGDVPISDLTPRHLDEWYRKLAAGEGRERPLKPASIRRHHAVLSAALNQAVRWGWLERNPAERAQPPPLGRTELQVPTPEEVRTLLVRGTERNERWGMLLSLAVLTGARRGELCAMRWTDIEGGQIRIRRSLYRAGTDRGEKSTKTGRERWVVVAPAGQALLATWHARCAEVADAADVSLVPDAFVVSPLPDGSRPVNPETFSSVVHKLCADLGMPYVHLHSIRHFAATEMLAAGVDPRNAAEILGHANPALTLGLYGHATADRQRAASEVLARTLPPRQDR